MQAAILYWAVLAASLISLPVAAQMYKWTDADGKVHYSDQPPPAGAKQQAMLKQQRPPAPATAPAQPQEAGKTGSGKPKTAAEQEMEFRKRRLEAAEAEAKQQKEAQAAQEKQRNCDQAKGRVAQLQAGGRITKNSPNGEQYYLEDAEIQRELIEARKAADSWCKG